MIKAKSIPVRLIIMIFLLQGCGGARKAVISGNMEIKTIWIKSLDLTTCNKQKILGKAGIRFIRDSVLFITLRNRSGMEGSRIYIYKDSIFVFNRINKTYYAEKIPGKTAENTGNERGKTESDLLRKDRQRKNFEYDLGSDNRVTVDVRRYISISGNYYMPGDVIIKVYYKGEGYCYRITEPKITVNGAVSIKRIKPGGKYKKIKTLDEVL